MSKNKSDKPAAGKDEILFKEGETCPYIQPGVYTATTSGGFFSDLYISIEKMELVSDSIIDLPSKEYKKTLEQVVEFQKPETRKKYEQYGFLYKRSVLLYGKPGTGKTCLVNRLAKYVADNSGIVFFVRNPGLMKFIFESMNHMNKAMFVCVILEEFDTLLAAEQSFLMLMDGQVQRNNVMYLATTNYIDRIPARLLRPGRFTSKVEVAYPDFECRNFYFFQKTKDTDLSKTLAEKTDGLSVDELKEVVQGYLILNFDLDELILDLRNSRASAEEADKDED